MSRLKKIRQNPFSRRLCHVGNLTNSFKKVAASLKSGGGRFFLHIITVRLPNNVSSVFTHKYIFPHGRYWIFDEVPRHDRDLRTVKRWYLNGINYSTTFAKWLKNFDDSYELISQRPRLRNRLC